MRRLFVGSLIVGLSACQGFISEPGQEPGGGGSGSGASGGSGAGSSTTKDALVPLPRVARLTHAQWENTVADLLYLSAPTGKSSGFPADPSTGGYLFDHDASNLSVDQSLWGTYQRAAEEIAEAVVGDAAQLAKILPPDTGDANARARAFVEELGKRAYRRPLTSAEIDRHMLIYQGAAGLFPSKPAFEAGIQLVLTAILQSPHFLYRIEQSTKADGGAIPVTPWEMASRLSYTLWNTMPDDLLFGAAGANELSSELQVEAQARRLLADPRADKVLQRFHDAVWELEKLDSISVVSSVFPDAPADLKHLAVEETERFIQFIFRGGGGYRDLLTSNVTPVTAETAKIYGLTGNFGSGWTEATLDPTQRKGIFTQIGFLAANSTGVDPDPIHRGAFLARRVTCIPLSFPAGAVPPLPAAGGKTNREVVASHTETEEECAGCHKQKINPYGFTFENYDAIGAWRTTDNGFAVDATASPLIEGEATPVSGAVELLDKIAESPAAHDCYARFWTEYAFGRSRVKQDDGVIRYLGQSSLEGASLEDLIVKLVTTRAFRHRSTEEMP